MATRKAREQRVSTIVIDGLNEEDFRRSIENRLREGMVGAAIERLRPLLKPYACPGGLLPERFLTVSANDLVLSGWDALRDAVRRFDLPGRRITAISITFGWPGEDAPKPDEEGRLQPRIETSYFSDNAYPFSLSMRDDLLEGYSVYGCSWAGDSEATDETLSLLGIDDLHGALALLEDQLLASDEPDEDAIRAGSLGACLLSALLVQAVGDRIDQDGLPRKLCVMAGSNGVYPYFDAPVVGMPEVEAKETAEAAEVFDISQGVPAPRYSSLLMSGIPRAKKRAVLVLDQSDDDMADRLARLRGLNHAESEDAEAPHQPSGREADHEVPAFLPEISDASPLLARKPAKKPLDFRDMLGPREAVPAAEAPSPPPPPPAPAPHELVEHAALPDLAGPVEAAIPAPPQAPPAAHPAGPGFALLEPDLQQRLQNLLAGNTLTVAETVWPDPPVPADIPEVHWPEEPGQRAEIAAPPEARAVPVKPASQPVPAGLGARLGCWLRELVQTFRARFGL